MEVVKFYITKNLYFYTHIKTHIFVGTQTSKYGVKAICGYYINEPFYMGLYHINEMDEEEKDNICKKCKQIDNCSFSDIEIKKENHDWYKYVSDEEKLDNEEEMKEFTTIPICELFV